MKHRSSRSSRRSRKYIKRGGMDEMDPGDEKELFDAYGEDAVIRNRNISPLNEEEGIGSDYLYDKQYIKPVLDKLKYAKELKRKFSNEKNTKKRKREIEKLRFSDVEPSQDEHSKDNSLDSFEFDSAVFDAEEPSKGGKKRRTRRRHRVKRRNTKRYRSRSRTRR